MPISVVGCELGDSVVDVRFSDGAGFKFHALWLRDAALETHDLGATSEKKLELSPIVVGGGKALATQPTEAFIAPDGALEIVWTTGDPIPKSVYPAAWLRAMGSLAGKPLEGTAAAAVPDDFFSFLEKGEGIDWARVQLWDSSSDIPRAKYADLESSAESQEALLRTIFERGIVIVDDLPEDPNRDASVLHDFAMKHLGGLQKHPLRHTANWTISTEDLTQFGGDNGSVAEVSGYKGIERETRAYDTSLQIQQHTDQSAYGTPGILLCFHCADGQGGNTVTDGFKVAHMMREQFPEDFKLLSTYGYNLGRRIEHYMTGMQLQIQSEPIFRLDAKGDIISVRYHELYRSALTIPFDVFPAFYAALGKFYELVHCAENMKRISLTKGQCLIMNNWRTMHGRAGLAGKRRTIIGGTVSQPSLLSQVRLVKENLTGLGSHETLGMPIGFFDAMQASKAK